jgi:hypothetical protein
MAFLIGVLTAMMMRTACDGMALPCLTCRITMQLEVGVDVFCVTHRHPCMLLDRAFFSSLQKFVLE